MMENIKMEKSKATSAVLPPKQTCGEKVRTEKAAAEAVDELLTRPNDLSLKESTETIIIDEATLAEIADEFGEDATPDATPDPADPAQAAIDTLLKDRTEDPAQEAIKELVKNTKAKITK